MPLLYHKFHIFARCILTSSMIKCNTLSSTPPFEALMGPLLESEPEGSSLGVEDRPDGKGSDPRGRVNSVSLE